METLKSVGMRALIFYFVMQFFRKPATAPGPLLLMVLTQKINFYLFCRGWRSWEACEGSCIKPFH